MITTESVILHLSLCEGIGPVFIQRFIAAMHGELFDVYQWSVFDWIQRVQISETKAVQLVEHLHSYQLLHDELARIDRVGAQWMTITDTRYPSLLRGIHAPPPVLYWRGSLNAVTDSQAVAIIGSRNANSYGVRVIKAFVPPLVDAGFTIVSGGALGADSMAHRETLAVGGKTVAVLGSGLMNLYPRTHIKMFEEIIVMGGAVVSALPIAMEPLPENFPARNRIIAGLSRGCLVIQAAAKSGTRITADFALQQGREVFVVPGPFDDPLSTGCHALAREGATLVTSAAEICAELGVGATIKDDAVIQEKIPVDTKPVYEVPREQSLAEKILTTMRIPMAIDDLVMQLALDYDLVQQELWNLQWKGKVHQDFTGRWTCGL